MALPYAEVIGDPIAQSKSPLIHRRWLQALRIEGEYRATRVPPSELEKFLRTRASDPDWRGCNATIPHKEQLLIHLDKVEDRAASIGAVNCVIPTSDGLVGYNTDVDGIAAALGEIAVRHRKIAIIGAGGAARALLAYLAEREVGEVVILARNPSKALPLRTIFDAGELHVGDFSMAGSLLENAAVIANASPLGMIGCPDFPAELLAALSAHASATFFDMVYNPPKTSFLEAGKGRVINGMAMLVGQAARAFELFFGTRPPTDDTIIADVFA